MCTCNAGGVHVDNMGPPMSSTARVLSQHQGYCMLCDRFSRICLSLCKANDNIVSANDDDASL